MHTTCGNEETADALVGVPELVREMRCEPHCGGGERVPDSDRAAVPVHRVWREPERLLHRQYLTRERLHAMKPADPLMNLCSGLQVAFTTFTLLSTIYTI